LNNFTSFPRIRRTLFFITGDILATITSILLSFLFRYEGKIPNHVLNSVVISCIGLPLFKVIIFALNRVYSYVWFAIDIYEIKSVVQSLLLSTLCALFFMLFRKNIVFFIPRSVLFMDFFLSILFTLSYRAVVSFVFRRKFRVRNLQQITSSFKPKKVLIFGAGEAGRMVINEASLYPELNLKFVGFLDDDKAKQNLRIAGVKVLGGIETLTKILQKEKIDELIIAMPSAPGSAIHKIVKTCEPFKNLEIKIVPGTRQIISGEVKWNQIRQIKVEDLLTRPPVKLDIKKTETLFNNKNILITGAGGSIGSELVRQILDLNPKKIILLGRGENSIFEIMTEIKNVADKKNIELLPFIADVRSKEVIEDLFNREKIHIVFHAAAHKHVPLMESHPAEAFLNNICGSLNVMEQAGKNKIERFVLISTDKAVNPVSVMGATKRATEILMRVCADLYKKTRFAAVRFGNVLESRGSVVLLFKHQIEKGGPVTVTDPEVTRYFMTIPEAVSLVIQAASLAKNGEIFILDMGEPVKIKDLATNLIRLSGFVPHKDIQIVYTGLRPGEKIKEELLTEGEGIRATKLDRIFLSPPEKHDKRIIKDIRDFEKIIFKKKPEDIKNFIFSIIKNY